jgi:ribonuclease Y
MVEIVVGGLSAAVSGLVGFLVSKKINEANFSIYVEQAKAKAKAIEHEAELLLENSKVKIKEAELEAKKSSQEEFSELKDKYNKKFSKLDKREHEFNKRLEKELGYINDEKKTLENFRKKLEAEERDVQKVKENYSDKLNEMIDTLSNYSGLTKDEAQKIVLNKTEEQCRDKISHTVRKYEQRAKEEASKKANFIIAQATTRFAGEFASERLINVVTLANDELKGRIIGKEGRNIKTLEMLLGVDIIIDETPNTIILSSFNLYRRAIATKTIEILIEDGRVQPSRIEEIYEKVCREFEEETLKEGEDIVLNLDLGYMHPELMKLIGKLKYRASYGQNALGHSLEVAHLSGIMAAQLGGDERLARRAGILHDIGKALTNDVQGNHVDLGADVCKRYKEHDVVLNAIYAHHGHEEAKYIESAVVCTADTLSAARPGARREVLESFLKRVEEIESIATNKNGVKTAFAINAGREVRVILSAELINDDEAYLIASEIAQEIEEKVQYPGEIKVNVIRELRAIEYAK